MREYYVFRAPHKVQDNNQEDHETEETRKEEPGEFWENPDYQKYKKKHGDHFCDKLAMWASKKMKNNPHAESGHTWTVEEVKGAFEKLGLSKPSTTTWGDVAYAANMAYADYYGYSLKTDADVIKQANADVIDPDGYPGKIFNRWLSDMMGKGIDVPWGEFIY